MTHGHGNNRAIYELVISMAKLDYQRILYTWSWCSWRLMTIHLPSYIYRYHLHTDCVWVSVGVGSFVCLLLYAFIHSRMVNTWFLFLLISCFKVIRPILPVYRSSDRAIFHLQIRPVASSPVKTPSQCQAAEKRRPSTGRGTSGPSGPGCGDQNGPIINHF